MAEAGSAHLRRRTRRSCYRPWPSSCLSPVAPSLSTVCSSQSSRRDSHLCHEASPSCSRWQAKADKLQLPQPQADPERPSPSMTHANPPHSDAPNAKPRAPPWTWARHLSRAVAGCTRMTYRYRCRRRSPLRAMATRDRPTKLTARCWNQAEDRDVPPLHPVQSRGSGAGTWVDSNAARRRPLS